VQKYGEFNDPMMGHRIAYSARTQISRKDFGLSFNMMLDGRFVVSDEIQIMIEGELVEQQEAAPPLPDGPASVVRTPWPGAGRTRIRTGPSRTGARW